MLKVKDFAEELPVKTLRKICSDFSIRGGPNKASMAVAVSKAFAKDAEAFAYSLNRVEMRDVLRRVRIEFDGKQHEVRALSALGAGDIRDILLAALTAKDGAELRRYYEPALDDEGQADDDEDDDQDAVESEDEEDEEGDDDDADEEPEESPEDVDLAADLGVPENGWGRARPLSGVLKALGHDVPQRLRAPRLHDLIAELATAGIRAKLVDGPTLTTSSDSPGIGVNVKLGRAHSVDSDPGSERPLKVEVAPPAPTRVPPVSSPQAVDPYEMASLRLAFLTAAPDPARPSRQNWARDFVDTACVGLPVSDAQVRLLLLASTQYASGMHDPMLAGALLFPAFPRGTRIGSFANMLV